MQSEQREKVTGQLKLQSLRNYLINQIFSRGGSSVAKKDIPSSGYRVTFTKKNW